MSARHLLISWAVILCCGCSSVEPLSIDCLRPAEISFPAELRRVAIVNNAVELPGPLEDPATSGAGSEGKRGEVIARYSGSTRLTAESLSEAIADEDYFDEVIICDSALRAQDSVFRPTELSRGEVARLAWQLGADVLIAVEALPIHTVERVEFDPYDDMYRATLDVKLFPVIRVYISGRTSPMATVVATDSIYFEAYGLSSWEARESLYTTGEMLSEVSRYAGETAARRLLPYWQTVERQMFTGGNSRMRDAAVYARRNQWTKAIDIWQQLYNDKTGRRSRLRTAHNMAIGYEMCDSITDALTWAERARDLSTEIYGPPSDDIETTHPYSQLIHDYCDELSRRRREAAILQAQMKRLEEE